MIHACVYYALLTFYVVWLRTEFIGIRLDGMKVKMLSVCTFQVALQYLAIAEFFG